MECRKLNVGGPKLNPELIIINVNKKAIKSYE